MPRPSSGRSDVYKRQREPRVNPGFDTRIPGIEVVDQPFAVGDGQQTLFRGVVADADDYAVEEVEGLVDQCRMAAGERVERPGENKMCIRDRPYMAIFAERIAGALRGLFPNM